MTFRLSMALGLTALLAQTASARGGGATRDRVSAVSELNIVYGFRGAGPIDSEVAHSTRRGVCRTDCRLVWRMSSTATCAALGRFEPTRTFASP